MSTEKLFVLLFLFQIKHFVCDYPLQKPYQYLNKGIYGHLGGILHATIHGIATFICLIFFTKYAVILCLFDAIIHYHIDWAKVKINKKYGWLCNNSDKFWILLGIDQLLHNLTYVLIIYFMLNYNL